MTGRLEGKVAFITGAARGQGRSHAVRLAEEGADIIAIDSCDQVASVPYPMSTPADLAQTVKEVEALGRRIVATQADVRDYEGLKKALDVGVAELGGVNIVVANAGIMSLGLTVDLDETAWQDVIDINLTGVWHTCKAAIPRLVERGAGGSIVIISSSRGLSGQLNIGHYVASKHGAIGLMRTLALELAPQFIRVNAVCPGSVNTEMLLNEPTYQRFRPDLENPSADDISEALTGLNALPVPWMECQDISNAVLFLASEEARYVTGVALPVDSGSLL